ncbi:MAG: glycosyltransferase [Chloroflexota bacterium]
MTRAVTLPLMAAQTTRDWTWIVLLDDRDPLLAERQRAFASAAPNFLPLIWRPEVESNNVGLRQRLAAADYRAPWRELVGPADDTVLTTRLDDDDGLVPDAVARYQRAARGITQRTILMLPIGIWLSAGHYSVVRHDRNAMHTLVTPPGDDGTVYDYGHTRVREIAPVVMVDGLPGWVWARHRDTISGGRTPGPYGPRPRPVNETIRKMAPIDWAAFS